MLSKSLSILQFSFFALSIQSLCILATGPIAQQQSSICSQAATLKPYASSVKQYKNLETSIKACQADPEKCQGIKTFLNNIEERQKNIENATEQFENGKICILEYDRILRDNHFLQINKIFSFYIETLQKTNAEILQINMKAIAFVQDELAKEKKLSETLKASLHCLDQKLHNIRK